MAALPKFEIFSGANDKDARWIEAVEGLADANKRMQQLAAERPGKYFIFSTATFTVLARIDTSATLKQRAASEPDAA